MPGRVGSMCAEELGSIARSRELEGLTLIRVGLLVVWTGPLALGVGLVMVGVDILVL